MALFGSAWILCTRRDIWTGYGKVVRRHGRPGRTPGLRRSAQEERIATAPWELEAGHEANGHAGRCLFNANEIQEAAAQRRRTQCNRALWRAGMYLRAASAYLSLPGARTRPFGVGSGGFCASDWRGDRERGGVWLRHLGTPRHFAPPARAETSVRADLRGAGR